MPQNPEDRIEFAGPKLEYTPYAGNNTDVPFQQRQAPDVIDGTYANLDYIRDRLNQLHIAVSALLTQCDQQLTNFALPITTDPSDNQLSQAMQSEWPQKLGAPSNAVTYQFYQMLRVKNTKAAAYIRSRYEDACRGVTGTNAIDVQPLLQMILDEISLVTEYLDTYIGDFNDTSEYRSAELFQDWVGNAFAWTSRIARLLQTTDANRTLPQNEVDQLAPTDASKAQALFKVKLNSLNDDIVQHTQNLQKIYSQYADVFYRQFLGPAQQFRLGVSRTVVPINTRVGKEMWTAAGSLDTNLSVAQGDQLRRNRIFDSKMGDLVDTITMRDHYRSYINQLATVGTTLVSGAPGTTINQSASPDQQNAFDEITQQNAGSAGTANVFTSPHNALEGRNAPDAHPQYLLASGGTLTGNVSVETGVTVDGVKLSTHGHTGSDGSSQINGTDIAFGTLEPSVVNTTAPPAQPQNLRVVRQSQRTLPSGGTVVDLDLAWDGDTFATYEVNVAPL